MAYFLHKYRGDDFRTDYGRLGELRAIIPPIVHVMALTATATKSSREKIMRSLRMINPVVVNLSPHKKNVVYTVHPKPQLEVQDARDLCTSAATTSLVAEAISNSAL